MNVAVVIATHGGAEWEQLARTRALPSTLGLGAEEIIPVHLANGTLAQARNVGAARVESEWLCFLDADDALSPGYLDAMDTASRLQSGEYLLVPAVQYVRRGKIQAPRVLNTGRPLQVINRAVIGTLIRRDLFVELGGFLDLPAYEDWELWLRAERAGAKLVDVPGAVYRAFVREGSRNTPTREAESLYWSLRREHEEWLASVPA